MIRAGKFWLGAMLVTAVAATGVTSASADAQELSEKSVTTLMEYAWSLVPAQFSQPDGKVIITDKKNKAASFVPVDTAKEIIRVARISAHAQICNMPEDQKANHRTLMQREDAKKSWSPQQMLYLNQLHLVTVMLMTGNVKVTEKDGTKEVAIEAEKTPSKTCSDEEKAKVKALIDGYIKAEGAPAAAPVAAAAPAAEKK